VHSDLPSDRDVEEFTFSPDASRIAFRGDIGLLGSDQIYVAELLGGGGPAQGVPVTPTPALTAMNASDFYWLRDSDSLIVRGDLVSDNVFEIYLTRVSGPTLTALHPPPPLNGDATTLFLPF